MSAIYQINKGVNSPMVFQGLRGQYIAWLAIGLLLLLVGFAVGYVSGINVYLLLPLVLALGGLLFWMVGWMSKHFGAYGMEKFLAKRALPSALVFRSRRVFIRLGQFPVDPGLKKRRADD